MGAFDQAIPWSTQSAKGCRRFLDRVWRLQENVTPDEGYSEKLNALMHETIKKVSLDYEAMKYNTAIAQMMTLVNEMVSVGSVTRGELKTLLLLLNPVAPHITEEMWENQGFGGTMTYQKWPTWDEDALVKSEIEIAVQVCGKVRGRVMIPADMTKERSGDGTPAATGNPEDPRGQDCDEGHLRAGSSGELHREVTYTM